MQAAAKNIISKRNFSFTYGAIAQSLILIVIYTVLSFVLPANPEIVGAHHLSASEYKVLRYVVSIPLMLVWITAFFGNAMLRRYANLIKDTTEGKAYKWMANGCGWLVWGLPISSLASLILGSISSQHHSFHAASIIIVNYISLILPLIGFCLLLVGCSHLLSIVRLNFDFTQARLIFTIYVLLSLLYCYLTLSRFSGNSSSSHNPYYISTLLMILTVIIPYLISWFVGFMATYGIMLYSDHIKGILYKRALSLLVYGLAIIILSAVAVQYLNTASPRTNHIILNGKLYIGIAFRVVSAIGFIVLSIGCQRLKRIEEI